MDIVEAYLESLIGDNKLLIFMKLPLEMRDLRSVRKRLVYKFLRSIYSLKQVGRLWNQKVITFLKTLGFNSLNVNSSILILTRSGEKILIIYVYIDNFFLASNNFKALQWLKNIITKEYNVKNLEEVCIIIGWQVTRNLEARTLKIDQSAFIQDLFKSENIIDYKSVNIPMKAGYFIKILEYNDYEEAEIKSNQRLIRNLIYLLYEPVQQTQFRS